MRMVVILFCSLHKKVRRRGEKYGKTIRKDPCLLDIEEYCSNFQQWKPLANLVNFSTINQSIGKCYWYRDGPRLENLGRQVVIRRATAALRHLLFCQNLGGGHTSPLPPASATPVVNLMVKTVWWRNGRTQNISWLNSTLRRIWLRCDKLRWRFTQPL